MDLRPVKNLDDLIGKSFDFKILKFNKKRGNIVLSRRVLLEKERDALRKETLKQMEEGAILNGIVNFKHPIKHSQFKQQPGLRLRRRQFEIGRFPAQSF